MAKKGKKLEEMTLDELRGEYRRIRERSQAPDHAAFDAACKELLKKKGIPLSDAKPIQYVAIARMVRFTCKRCAGTGRFITGTLNGQPVGPGGPCYRCAGKGTQDDADARRNYGADNHAIVRAFHQMMGE